MQCPTLQRSNNQPEGEKPYRPTKGPRYRHLVQVLLGETEYNRIEPALRLDRNLREPQFAQHALPILVCVTPEVARIGMDAMHKGGGHHQSPTSFQDTEDFAQRWPRVPDVFQDFGAEDDVKRFRGHRYTNGIANHVSTLVSGQIGIYYAQIIVADVKHAPLCRLVSSQVQNKTTSAQARDAPEAEVVNKVPSYRVSERVES